MSKKHSPTISDTEQPSADNLRLINGIGPVVEKRLNGVGIFTFAQLAALSPADIAAAVADLAGLSTERIIKQDWIGQAHKLAGEAQQDIVAAVETPTPIEEHVPADEQQTEPEQPDEVEAESPVGEAEMDVEAAALTEQPVTSTPVELPPDSLENMHQAESTAAPEMVVLPSEERYQSATFTVELLLDENKRVYSIRAVHIRSGHEQTWPGWQEMRLVDFLSQSAGVNITPEEKALPDTEASGQIHALATASELLPPVTESSYFAGTLRVRDIETLRAGSNNSSRLLTSNEPFDVRLTLDLTELQVPGSTLLNYKASIFGKSRDTDIYDGLIKEAQGTITHDDTASITVKGNSLPEGVYQIRAMVTLGLPGKELTPRSGTTATINGGLVQVYQAF